MRLRLADLSSIPSIFPTTFSNKDLNDNKDNKDKRDLQAP
jgi:hypothetical protein